MEQITLAIRLFSPVTTAEAKYFVDLVVEGRGFNLSSYFSCVLLYHKAAPTWLLKSPLKVCKYLYKRLED